MTVPELWPAAPALLLAAGAWRVATAERFVGRLVALNVMAAAATLLLAVVGEVSAVADPREARTMAVLGVVVMFGVTAFGAQLARRSGGDHADPGAAG